MDRYEKNIRERFNFKSDFLDVNNSVKVFNDILAWNSIDLDKNKFQLSVPTMECAKQGDSET